VIDLHCHSSFSDGSDSPSRLCEIAVAAGCSALALTDHDTIDGLSEAAARAESLGIGFVAGCEVSCHYSPGTMHLLCHFVSGDKSPLHSEIARLAEDRVERNREMVASLQSLGLPISYPEVEEEAGGRGIGRPHFAAVLVSNGAASSIADAFDRYLAKGRPGYVHKRPVEAAHIIQTARISGAVVTLAHPLSLGVERDVFDTTLRELTALGLSGLECYYGRYDQETRAALVVSARRHGLVPTGGSDYHGRYKPDLALGIGTGDLAVPDSVLGELAERRP
jgi:predicted metal-dependent phosphoesterase TrpH